MMLEARLRSLRGERERDPALNPVHADTGRPRRGTGALGVDDALPCDHPVDVAGKMRLQRAQAVAVIELALEEVGDGGELDVRMGPDVKALTRREARRTHVVQEDEGADKAALRRRQDAADGEASEVAGARPDAKLDVRGRRADMRIRLMRGRSTGHWPMVAGSD